MKLETLTKSLRTGLQNLLGMSYLRIVTYICLVSVLTPILKIEFHYVLMHAVLVFVLLFLFCGGGGRGRYLAF